MILTQTIIFLFEQHQQSDSLIQIHISNLMKDYVFSFPVAQYKSLIGHSQQDLFMMKLSGLREFIIDMSEFDFESMIINCEYKNRKQYSNNVIEGLTKMYIDESCIE